MYIDVWAVMLAGLKVDETVALMGAVLVER